MHQILIIDDDIHLRKLVKTYAGLEDMACDEAENGQAGLEKIKEKAYELVVLDVTMPVMDGYETLTELRKESEVPVIMLTARHEEYDRLLGFGLGADDYISKPFSPKELMARIHAVLKRSHAADPEETLTFGGLSINENARTVLVDGQEVGLPPKEFELLLLFARNNHSVMSREQLLQNVWGYDYFGDARTIDTHIRSLRDHIGPYRELIKTVWGVGYKFEYTEK